MPEISFNKKSYYHNRIYYYRMLTFHQGAGRDRSVCPFAAARRRWRRAEYVRLRWLRPALTFPLHAHGSGLGRGNCNTFEVNTLRSRGACREQQLYSCKEFEPRSRAGFQQS